MAERIVVLGANVDGLAAATSLARAGKRVVLLERSDAVGGVAAPVEVGAGHVVPGLVHDPALARRQSLEALGLGTHGLLWRAEPTLGVPGDQGWVRLNRDPAGLAGAPAELDTYEAWRDFVARVAPLVTRTLDEPPPDTIDPRPGELLRLARRGFELRALGSADLMELTRIVPTCAQDWTGELFGDARVRVGLVAPTLSGTVLGPRAAGTSALLLMGECVRGGEPVGGAAGLVEALLASAHAAGVEVRTGVRCRRLSLGANGVEALELEDGEPVPADAVLSADDLAHTLLELVPAGTLPASHARAALGWRTRGDSAFLLLALSSPPRFAGAEDDPPPRVIDARSLDELERSADALKYGVLPQDPWLDVRVWSATDAACAPAGTATLSVRLHGVPHALRAGWDDAARERLAQAALARLERLAPGIGGKVVAQRLLAPPDLEARCGSGGHLLGGELALDQLWLQRPSLALARYRTDVPGLFLGGPASHPGGPFLGGAGILAARALLDA